MNNISLKKNKSRQVKSLLFALMIIAGVLIASIGGRGLEIIGGVLIGTGLGFMLWDVWIGKWWIFEVD